MRYSPRHKAKTHARLVRVASKLFRAKGYATVGVDDVMAAAGLTAGAFYAHFDSKETLLAEVLADAFPRAYARLGGPGEGKPGHAWLANIVSRYLSPAHRDVPAHGCPVPSLGAEVGRRGARVRRTFEAQVLAVVRKIEAAFGRAVPGDLHIATLALCVGGIALARAVHTRALSDRILRACRNLATDLVSR